MCLSIFSALAALMSADIAWNLWSLVCSCLNSYCTFHLFPLLIFFFKFVAFCTEYNLFTPFVLFPFMIMDLPYICDHQVGSSAGGYSLSTRWFLTWCVYPFFQDYLHWWVLILHETYDHWSLAVLTVTVHFSLIIPFDFFFQISCFFHWIQSVYSICFVSLYDNGSPLYLWWSSGLLCWWIFIVAEVVLNLVCLSIFSGLAALLSADIARNLWSLVCSCLNSYCTFHLFPLLFFFFKFVAFCTEYNLFTPFVLFPYMIMDLHYICDDQVGYSAGGYSLS